MAAIEKRNNSYKIMVSCGYDMNGKQIRKRMVWTPSPGMTEKQIKKELERQSVLFEEKCQTGQVLDNTITFAKFADKWFKEYAEKQLQPKTIARYKDFMERINPAIGQIKLSKLRRTHLIELYNNLSEPGLRKDIKYQYIYDDLKELIKNRSISKTKLAHNIGVSFDTINYILAGKGISKANAEKVSMYLKKPMSKLFTPINADKTLSNRTIMSPHKLIKTILNTAIAWGVIPSNPANGATPPKVEYKESNFLDDIQAKELLLLIQDAPVQYRTMVITLIYTGMRIGELCGLEWKDVDFKNNTITVRRSSQYLPGKGTFTKEPKNKSSIRTNVYGDYLFKELKSFKAWQSEQRLKIGDQWHDTDRLFTRLDGKDIYPNSLGAWLHKFLAKTNLPPISVHSLRHAYASILIAAGTDIETVSKRLGHSQTSTTMNIYAHALASRDRKAATVMDSALDISNMTKIN